MDPNARTLITKGIAFEVGLQKILRRQIWTLLRPVLGGPDPYKIVGVPSKMFHVGDACSHCDL